MALDWKTLPDTIPRDGRVYWVRLNYWFGQPFQATWVETDLVFRVTDTVELDYPFWTVSRFALA